MTSNRPSYEYSYHKYFDRDLINFTIRLEATHGGKKTRVEYTEGTHTARAPGIEYELLGNIIHQRLEPKNSVVLKFSVDASPEEVIRRLIEKRFMVIDPHAEAAYRALEITPAALQKTGDTPTQGTNTEPTQRRG